MKKSNPIPYLKRLIAIFQWGNHFHQGYHSALKRWFSLAYTNLIRAMRSCSGRDEVDTMNVSVFKDSEIKPEFSNLSDLHRRFLEICLKASCSNLQNQVGIEKLSPEQLQELIINSGLDADLNSIWDPYLIYISSNNYSYKRNAKAIDEVSRNMISFINNNKLDINCINQELNKIYKNLCTAGLVMRACYHLLESPSRRKDALEQVKEVRKGISMIAFNTGDIYKYIVSSKNIAGIPGAIKNIETLSYELINFNWDVDYFIKNKIKKKEAVKNFNEAICFAKSILWDFAVLRERFPFPKEDLDVFDRWEQDLASAEELTELEEEGYKRVMQRLGA